MKAHVDAVIVVFILMILAVAIYRAHPRHERVTEVEVTAGDTLWKLSDPRRDGADPRNWIAEAYRLNPGLNASGLRPGQRLIVPDWRGR